MFMNKFLTLLACVAIPAIGFASSYKLDDFAGDFAVVISTPGTPNITAINPQIAPTATVIAHATLNKEGNGELDFISQTVFTGPVAPPAVSNIQTLRTFTGAPEFQIHLELKDAKKGVGTLTLFNYPISGVNTEFDFVAVGKDKVKKLYSNVVSNPVSIGAVNFMAERQK